MNILCNKAFNNKFGFQEHISKCQIPLGKLQIWCVVYYSRKAAIQSLSLEAEAKTTDNKYSIFIYKILNQSWVS